MLKRENMNIFWKTVFVHFVMLAMLLRNMHILPWWRGLTIHHWHIWKMLYSNMMASHDTVDYVCRAGITWSMLSRTIEKVAVHHSPPQAPVWHPQKISVSVATDMYDTHVHDIYWIETRIGKIDKKSRCHNVEKHVNSPMSQMHPR